VVFVTTVLLPAVRDLHAPAEKVIFFKTVERGLEAGARHDVACRALRLPPGRPARFVGPLLAVTHWWMHALVAVWLLFTLMLLASSRAVPAGTDVRTLKDPIGTELYAAAQSPEGQIAEVGPYLFPKPGTTTPVLPKVSLWAIWLAASAIINSSFGLRS